MKFEELVSIIKETDSFLKQRAYYAVNKALTTRNWLYGLYIVEFEQNGEDRAAYGSHLLEKLSKPLVNSGIKAASDRDLRKYRQFYLTYPAIWMTLASEFKTNKIWVTLTSELDKLTDNKQITQHFGVEPELILAKFSFSHIAELIKINEPLKRAFYEIECVNCNWSVRELQRQIGSLLFERTGLSTNKEKMLEIANKKSTHFLPDDIIRDPYIFEFLGLKQKDVLPETTFEELLIAHLQEFLLELGKGFCFEARQKRITIDNKHYYIDLVFYHKILKCNVIIELKMRDFEHADASQLKVYLNYWKKYEMQTDDNPPVGILLCTGKNDELVEFTTAGDEQLFVSKYMVELPSAKELKEFIHKLKVNNTRND
jgi:predicted nuclease of restriction endonuclease-like (RecB) superfamily